MSPWSRLAVSALVLAVGCTETRDRPAAPAPAPAAAPFDLEAVVRQVRHGFRPLATEPGFRTGHPTFAAEVTGRELRFTPLRPDGAAAPTLSLATVAVGRGRIEPVEDAAPRVEPDGHLAVARGIAIEHLRNEDGGLHQTFRFEAAPPGSGDLVVRLRVTGAPLAAVTAEGHDFLDPATGVGLRYGAATWVDARGDRTPMTVRSEGDGVLALVVPAAVVAASAYPAEIDPLVSARLGVNVPVQGDANLGQFRPAVAFDGTNWLVVWNDDRAITGYRYRIDGVRVSASGAILDPAGFTVLTDAMGGDTTPAVAFDGTNYLVVAVDLNGTIRARRVTPSGQLLDTGSGKTIATTSAYVSDVAVAFGTTSYLVTWTSYTPGNVLARRVDLAGAGIGGTITVASPSGGGNTPKVAFDGTNFLVVWKNGQTNYAGPVAAARVAESGAVLDATPIVLAASGGWAPAIAAGGGQSLVVWRKDASSTQTIVGTRVDVAGAALDPAGLAVSGTGASSPAVGWDGQRFVVVWTRWTAGVSELLANRVGSAGAILDGTGTVVSPAGANPSYPSIACGAGTCLPVWEEASGNEVYGTRLQAGASVDPAGLHISAAASEQARPAVTFANGQYFVVWEDRWTGADWDVYGARIDANGTVLDPAGIEIASAPRDQLTPRVAAAADGYLVVWSDDRAAVTTYRDVYAARVTAAGVLLDPQGIRVGTTDNTDEPVVASDGAGYLVAWHAASAPFTNDLIQATRVSAAGAILDAPPLALTPSGGATYPSVAFGGGRYLVAWESGAGVKGARITPAGAILDAPPGLAIASGGYPSVAWDGSNFVVAYRRYTGTGSNYRFWATRVAGSGAVLDPAGISLTATGVYGYTSAWYREGPEATFDGADTLVVWPTSFSGGTVRGAWLSPQGVVFGESTLVDALPGIPLSPAVAGRGDGVHSLLVYAFGDTATGIRNFRTSASVVTFRLAGQACGSSPECKSGFCVDGVCCRTACGAGAGDCQVCSVAAGAHVDGECELVAAGAECRAAAGPCDVAEACTGAAPACPGDAFRPPTAVCRDAAGDCDLAETCSGTAAACPADAVKPASAVCRAELPGGCDVPERCDGLGVACPADGFVAGGTVCRDVAGPCDVAEACTGASGACPADGFAAPTTVCRDASGPCDLPETCTGAGPGCGPDGFVDAGTVCRPAAGACDVAETCTGGDGACPADGLVAAGLACRPAAGPCDVPEACNGVAPGCPADLVLPPTEVCRPVAPGGCDVPERCDGATVGCPPDLYASATTVCRDVAGACDRAEMCSGTSAACPEDLVRPASEPCRSPAGPCDAEERCTGVDPACPADGFLDGSHACREAAGPCDVEERCGGASAACPADALARAGTECRAKNGACDRAETCTGSAATCPADSLAPASETCRAAAGACDVAERCPGDGRDCPADVLAGAGTVCRPAAGACDVEETCPGGTAACPQDRFVTDGTDCDDGDDCTADDACRAGSCTGADVCADTDGDGIADADEERLGLDQDAPDSDADGIRDGDECDPTHPEDTDDDGVLDALDDDSDDDGIADRDEAGDGDPATPPVDTDGDGAADFRDGDADDDRIPDGADDCRLVADPGQDDADGDGAGDACDDDGAGGSPGSETAASGCGCHAGASGADAGPLVLLGLALAALHRGRPTTRRSAPPATRRSGQHAPLGRAPAAAYPWLGETPRRGTCRRRFPRR